MDAGAPGRATISVEHKDLRPRLHRRRRRTPSPQPPPSRYAGSSLYVPSRCDAPASRSSPRRCQHAGQVRVTGISRLPAAKLTASQTWRFTTWNSSTIASDGFHHCRAPGSAGSTTNVESVCGTYCRDWNTCVCSASRGSNSTMREICLSVIPACLASEATTTTSAD